MKKKVLTMFLAVSVCLTSFGMMAVQAEAAEKETYAWDTATTTTTGPIKGTYSLGSSLHFYEGDGADTYTLENLYDGDYTTKTVYNYTRNTGTTGVTPGTEENCYIEIGLDGFYQIDSLLIGINSDDHAKNRMARCYLTYKNPETGVWEQGEKFAESWGIDINYKYNDDAGVLKKKAVMIDSSYTISNFTFGTTMTDTIRVYPTCIVKGGTRLEIDELVVYGKEVPRYEWNTPEKESSYTVSGYLPAAYSVPATFSWNNGVALTNEQVTTNLTDCNVGGSEVATVSNGVGAVIPGSGKNEWIEDQNYIEMDFGKYCTVDSIYYAGKNEHIEKGRVIGRYNVKYYDEHNGEWITAGTRLYSAALSQYTNSETGAYKYTNLGVGSKPITAKKIRLEFFRPNEYYNPNLICMGELIPVGVIASDVPDVTFAFKDADGNELADFGEGAVAVAPAISVIKPADGKYAQATLVTACYNETGLLNCRPTAMNSDGTAADTTELTIPEGTTQIKVFLWEMDNMTPLTGAFTKKKLK